MDLSHLVPSFLKELVGCSFGHDWEEQPRTVGPVKLSGMNVVFWTYGKQDGTQHCSRCEATRAVTRSGMVGAGVPEPKWEPK
jgi:hypothetical protein